MQILSEFRKFIQRGSVVDLAVGLIMGGAFTKIVNSLVADILMPPIGYLIGGVHFKDLKYTLPEKILPEVLTLGKSAEKLPPASINYGAFLQATFDFLIIAFCVFLMVKAMNEFQRRIDRGEVAPPAPPPPTPSEKLLTEIRDLLQQSGSTAK